MTQLYLEEFKDDALVQSLYKGAITIPQFINSITEDKPYHLIDVYEGKKQVMSKKSTMPLQMRIPPEKIKEIDKHYDKILLAYPELQEYINYALRKVKEGCSSCNKNGFMMNILNCIVMLGGSGRDIESLAEVFGEIFAKELSIKPIEMNFDLHKHLAQLMQMPQNRNNLQLKQYQNAGGRKSCISCVCKHLASAMIYIQEYKNGYPLHIWGAVGEMVHAESEAIDSFPEFSRMIRQERLNIMEDNNYSPDFFDLIKKAIENK